MKTGWFKKWGGSYLPISAEGGWVTFSLGLAGWFFIAIDHHSHSLSDTLIHFFVYFTCVAFWWKWVAEKTCS